MTKSQAKYIFHGTSHMAKALGITRQAIHKWNNELTEKQENMVIGAALRLGIDTKIPEGVK